MSVIDARHNPATRKPLAAICRVVKIGNRLHGTVYNHRGFRAGDNVTTSPILNQFTVGGVSFAETENTLYVLLGGCK